MTQGAWLITGASGFLGRHILQVLSTSTNSRPVVALIRDPAGWRALDWTRPLERVDTVTGSVTGIERWQDSPALEGLAGIIHGAAVVRHSRRDAALVERTTVDGTLAMVRLAARHRCRLVFVSTSGTVGCFARPGPSADENAPYCAAEVVAHWPYYRSKIEAERQARRLAEELGVDLVIARPPVLLGPGDHRYRSTATLIRFLDGRLPFLIQGGMHFADVRDVAQALVRIMELPRARPVYHLPGTVCTIPEFFQMAAQVSGRPAPRIVVPFRLAWWLATLSDRAGLLLRGRPFAWLPDPSLVEMAGRYWAVHSLWAATELGYQTRAPEETLADTVNWIREKR